MRENLCNEIRITLIKQKHAVRIVFNKDQLTHSKSLLENHNTLHMFQANINQYSNFKNKFINNQISSISSDLIKRPHHKHLLQTFHSQVFT